MDAWELYNMLLKKFGEIPDPRHQPKKFEYYVKLLRENNGGKT